MAVGGGGARQDRRGEGQAEGTHRRLLLSLSFPFLLCSFHSYVFTLHTTSESSPSITCPRRARLDLPFRDIPDYFLLIACVLGSMRGESILDETDTVCLSYSSYTAMLGSSLTSDLVDWSRMLLAVIM